MTAVTLPERLPPIPETAAGRIVATYLLRLPRETSRVVEHAARCSRGLHGDVQAAQVIQAVSEGNYAVRTEGIDANTMRSVVIAVACWGTETRRTRFNSESGFATLGTALGRLRDRGVMPQAVSRSVNTLARASAVNVQREVQRASLLLASAGGGNSYNHALLADDVYLILSKKNLTITRMRFAVESGTGNLLREVPRKSSYDAPSPN